MIDNEKIEFALALNLAQFRRNAKLAVGKVQNMSGQIKKSVNDSAADFGRLKTGVLSIGIAAGAVAAGGLLVLKNSLQEAIGLANVQIDAEIRAAAVIRATGAAAGYTVGELTAMAGKFQEVTTVGDETTIAAASVLATFKEIKRQGGIFEGAIAAALDMNAVIGGDLQGNIIQLGKALNDPIKGVSALSRVGVSFTETQKEMIRKFVESGNIMGAQQVILQELRSEFGGTAAALRGSFKGAVESASNAWGDLYEETGYAITKNEFFIETAKIIEQRIISLTGGIKNNEQAMRDLAKNGALAVVSGLGMAVETIRFFYNGWQGLKLVAHGAVTLIIKGLELVVKGLRKTLFPLDLLLQGLAKIGVIESNPLEDLENTLKGFGDFSADELGKLYDKVEDGNAKFDAVKDKIAAFKSEIASIPAAKVDVAQDIQKETDKNLKSGPTYGATSYTKDSKVSDDMKLVNGQWVSTSPVKNTVDNFKSPVEHERTPWKETTPEKTFRLELPNGASLKGDASQEEKVIDGLAQAGLTAQ